MISSNRTHRKIRAASADGAYDPRLCHDELRRKKISALIPPRKGAGYWPGDYADRNRAVANQRMTGSNARWKWTTDYNRRPQRYSDLAITTVLVIKRVFRLTLRAAQGFIDSIFSLMNVPLRCPDYSCVSRRAKSVNISFKTPTRGEIAHLVIDSTGLKVFGEGEWKVKKHGQERRRIWRKLHLAVDSKTHEIICADLSLNNVTDSEAFPGLIRQTFLPERERDSCLVSMQSAIVLLRISD
uniref:Mobile element protein n=1 Tax=Klebsiella pneumoniae TaxID=573 RepID=A0A6G9I035_KLEPN|nr:Mobile element protein [Klebsiella pneumoniae]